MAIVSKFSHASATVDLNDTATGFSLSGDGWLPVVATPVYGRDPEPVTETLHLLLRNATQDAIAGSMQALHFMQVQADAYINDPTVDDPVWLHAKMNSETGERRAVVYKIEVQYGASWYGEEATSLDIPLTLSITRGPYWESTTARDLPADTGVTGGAIYVYNYTATGASVAAHDIVGDVGARISFFSFNSVTVGISDYWIGTRSAPKHGATGISNFVATWELENGTLGTDCATAADTGASGAGRITVSESALNWDNEWHNIVNMKLSDVTANEEDCMGSFLWFIRAMATAGTWEVYMTYGNAQQATTTYKKGRVSEISTTGYQIYETDISKIPNSDIKAILNSDVSYSSRVGGYAMYVYGRRTSGAGNLYLDCLYSLPVDEGFIKLSRFLTGEFQSYFGESPIGTLYSYSNNPLYGTEGDVLTVSNNNFTLPIGDGRFYVISTSATANHSFSSITTFNASDSGKYYERWLSLRGAE